MSGKRLGWKKEIIIKNKEKRDIKSHIEVIIGVDSRYDEGAYL